MNIHVQNMEAWTRNIIRKKAEWQPGHFDYVKTLDYISNVYTIYNNKTFQWPKKN